jgi:DnaJ-class molecular chaperone
MVLQAVPRGSRAMTEGKQECRLCEGSGICPFNTYARCSRCDGKRELDASVDQSKPIMTTMGCGSCGGVHEGPDTLYVIPCPERSGL